MNKIEVEINGMKLVISKYKKQEFCIKQFIAEKPKPNKFISTNHKFFIKTEHIELISAINSLDDLFVYDKLSIYGCIAYYDVFNLTESAYLQLI